jgi:hypothetical protein
MQSPVIKYDSFNPQTVTYMKAKTNKSGGKSVGIKLMLECPLMLTWGANKFTDEVSGRSTYKMALAFPRQDYANAETDLFLKKMVDLETKIKDDATKNSMEWFNKPKDKMPAQVVDALFNPMLKWPKDPLTGDRDMTKTPTLDVKLENYDGFNCELYDVNGEMLFPDKTDSEVTPLTLIPKLTNIACVIQCGGLWFAGGKFGVTWKLFQGVVQPRPSLKGKCLISLTPAAKTTLVKAVQEDEVDEHSGESSLVVADDSDVEDEQPAQVKAPASAVQPAKAAQASAVQPAKAAAQQAPVTAEEQAPAQASAVQQASAATPKVIKKVVRTAKKD